MGAIVNLAIALSRVYAFCDVVQRAIDRNFTQDKADQHVNTGIVDIFVYPMVAAKSTIAYLQEVMPGQPEAWYQRIAAEITAGRMPLPTISVAPAEPVAPPKPPAKPKSKTKKLKEGTYRSKTPNTVEDILKQCDRPVSEPKPRPAKPASETTKRRLYRLTKDWKTAFRLVDKLQIVHSDKSEQWCWEKAIYDLERDRHV